MDLSMWSLLNATTGVEEHATPPIVPEVPDPNKVKNIIEETELHEMEVENIRLKQDFVELTDMSEKLENKVENLDGVVQGTEALINGVWNADAFSYFYNRGCRIAASITGKESMNVLGAESLSDAGTAELAAREGMEGIVGAVTDGIKKLLAMIWEMVKRFGAWVKSKTSGIEAAKKKLTSLKNSLHDLVGRKYKGKIDLTKKESERIYFVGGKPILDKFPSGVGRVAELMEELYSSVTSARSESDLTKTIGVYNKVISEFVSSKGIFSISTQMGTSRSIKDDNGGLVSVFYTHKSVNSVPQLIEALTGFNIRPATGFGEATTGVQVNCTGRALNEILDTAESNLKAALTFQDKLTVLARQTDKLEGLTKGEVKREHHGIVLAAGKICRAYTFYLKDILEAATDSVDVVVSVSNKVRKIGVDLPEGH